MSRPFGIGPGGLLSIRAIAARTGESKSTVYRDYRSALAKMGIALEEVPRRPLHRDAAKKLALT